MSNYLKERKEKFLKLKEKINSLKNIEKESLNSNPTPILPPNFKLN